MKKFLFTAGALSVTAAAAVAGGLADAIVETEPTEVLPPVADTAGSLPSWVIPLAVVGLFAVAMAGDGGESGNGGYRN